MKSSCLGLFMLFMAVTGNATAYSFGVVPQFDSRQTQRIWQPILAHISKLSGENLTFKENISFAKFERTFQAGKFDFVYLNPYQLLMAHKSNGYEPIIHDAGRKLVGIIVVRKESPVQTLQDLEGKLMSFPSPNAFAASMLIRTELMQAGITIQTRYLLNHSGVYQSVVAGQANAGGGIYQTLEQQDIEIREQLRVVYETKPNPPHPIAVHPHVPTAVRDKVRAAFFEFSASDIGHALLSQIPITQIGDTTLEQYIQAVSTNVENHFVTEKE